MCSRSGPVSPRMAEPGPGREREGSTVQQFRQLSQGVGDVPSAAITCRLTHGELDWGA